MRFANPLFLLLILLLIPVFYLASKKRTSAIRFSNIEFFKKTFNYGQYLKYILSFLYLLIFILIVLGLARPQHGRVFEEVETHGVDIMLCIDVSTSMKAEDFNPKNRLFVAKEKAKEFINKRKGDRIGLVIFAQDALTQCPLTFDHNVLIKLIDYINFGILEDGTAIGTGLATAVARLKDAKAKEKMIILLTDGVNNAGEIDPVSAAKIAQTYGIKVYCIGVGTKGKVPYPIDHPVFGRQYVQVEIDFNMETLNQIAGITGAKAFLASDATTLGTIYNEIDKMEPTTFRVKKHTVYAERATYYILPAFILLLFTTILHLTIFRRLP